MALPEERTHVFVVRIWREPREIEGARPLWRGWIEHTATSERRYLTTLDAIGAFIRPYLEHMGVQVEARGRTGRWRSDWRRLFRGRQ